MIRHTSKCTTNGCESFQREFGDMFYHPHSATFKFLDKLKSILTKSYLKICASQLAASLVKREME